MDAGPSDGAALAQLMLGAARFNAILLAVLWAQVAAEERAVHFHDARQPVGPWSRLPWHRGACAEDPRRLVLDVDVARELRWSATIFACHKLPFTDTLGAIAILSNAAKGFSATSNVEEIIHLSSAVVRLLRNAGIMLLFGALGVWHRMS